MPTKGKRGSAYFSLSVFNMVKSFKVADLGGLFGRVYRKTSCGMSKSAAWLALFDPLRTDLASLPIRLLDVKAMRLPRGAIPTNLDALKHHCRWLIDAGTDEYHIQLVTSSPHWSVTVEEHAADLWQLRTDHPKIFEAIVTGRFGSAMVIMEKAPKMSAAEKQAIKALALRHSLLWCALDMQLVAARGRASVEAPLGPLVKLRGGAKEIKAGTVIRLMKATRWTLAKCLAFYTFGPDPALSRAERRKGETLIRKNGGFLSDAVGGPIASDEKALLDSFVSRAQGALGHLDEAIDRLSTYRSEEARRGPANASNAHIHFHALWYSGLSHAEGLAVAAIRFVQAEHDAVSMLNRSHNHAASHRRTPDFMGGVSVPPTDKRRILALLERTLALVDSARRCQLRDSDWRTRTIPDRTLIKEWLEAEPVRYDYEKLDRAGVKFVGSALQFLRDMGQRKWDARDSRWSVDDRHLTYWLMDVIPERRFCQ